MAKGEITGICKKKKKEHYAMPSSVVFHQHPGNLTVCNTHDPIKK